MAPRACASAMQRSASVVLPLDRSPRSAALTWRGSPPGPSSASSRGNPVETMSSPMGCRGWARGAESGLGSSAGASARAPWVSGEDPVMPWINAGPVPFPMRIEALPHRL